MSTRLSLLVDLASLLSREVELDAWLQSACDRLKAAFDCERATLWLFDGSSGDLVSRVAVLPELPQLRQPRGRGIVGLAAQTGALVVSENVATDPRFDQEVDRKTGYVTRNVIAAPIREHEGSPIRGVLQLLNQVRDATRTKFSADDEDFLRALTCQLARALDYTTLRARGAEPGVVLRGPFNRIVGRSAALDDVYERVQRAAETDATVLLRGETGTGKGLLARAIHVNSRRQSGPFVTVDATTLPRDLVESELFGHERGAFTGADRRVLGKVETAQGGTLFLDEIGDLSLESQGKFLRLMQDRTFERVGGRTTTHADVRFVCATHRDLEAAVASGTFRADLYYRLRVVEIEVPPLRARGESDIRALAAHFADVYATRYGRPAPRFTTAAEALLLAHPFPGNVRELEHWVESAVVLSRDGVLDASAFPVKASVAQAAQTARGPEKPPAHLQPSGAPLDEVSGAKLAAGLEAAAPATVAGQIALPLGLSAEEAARRYAAATLEAAGGRRLEAAKRLGIGRNTLARILK